MPTIATMFNWLYFNIGFEDSLGHCFLVSHSFFPLILVFFQLSLSQKLILQLPDKSFFYPERSDHVKTAGSGLLFRCLFVYSHKLSDTAIF